VVVLGTIATESRRLSEAEVVVLQRYFCTSPFFEPTTTLTALVPFCDEVVLVEAVDSVAQYWPLSFLQHTAFRNGTSMYRVS